MYLCRIVRSLYLCYTLYFVVHWSCYCQVIASVLYFIFCGALIMLLSGHCICAILYILWCTDHAIVRSLYLCYTLYFVVHWSCYCQVIVSVLYIIFCGALIMLLSGHCICVKHCSFDDTHSITLYVLWKHLNTHIWSLISLKNWCKEAIKTLTINILIYLYTRTNRPWYSFR